MKRPTRAAHSPPAPPRRRRPARKPGPFGVLPTDPTPDDLAEADALYADLVALVEAGLVEAVDDGDGVRYAATEERGEEGPPAA